MRIGADVLKGARVLVTGVAGFIGSHLADRLVGQGSEVVGLDNFSNGFKENLSALIKNKRFTLIKGDILNLNDVRKALKGTDAIFHMAAQSSVPKSTEDPSKDFEINVRGTLNVLECARKSGVKAVIFASSSTVYGEATIFPTPEHHPMLPISNYGAAKAAGEVYCTSYFSLYGLRTASLRYYNIYGPRSRKGVMFDLLQKLQRNHRKLEVLGTGAQTKDYLYIEDAVKATILVAAKRELKGEAYNVGSGESYTVEEIAKKLLGILGLVGKTGLFYKGGLSWAGDVQKTHADISKLKKLGFKQEIGIGQGLSAFVDWYRSNYGEIVRR